MPILAGGIPVIDTPKLAQAFAESRSLNLRRVSDGVYPLDATGQEFFFRSGCEGLGLAPREVIRDTQQGMTGARIREIRDLERPIFLPLFVSSDSSHFDFLNRQGALDSLFYYRNVDYRNLDGTFDLVASSPSGERSLRCVYLEGREGNMHPIESTSWGSWGIRALAVRPYWNGGEWTTPLVRQSSRYPFPGALGDGFASARALGADIRVTVPGNVETWAQVEVTGPADSVMVTGPGLSVSIPGGVEDGETFHLITEAPPRRQALFNGVADWSRVAHSDSYSAIFPGDQFISIVITGASGATTARVFGDVWWEQPW